MTRSIPILTFICILVLTATCYSGTRHPDTSDEKHIEYGKGFPFVGRLIVINSNNETYSASAVAYSDNIIITAAHVLDGKKDCFIDINNKKIYILRTISHKDYQHENHGVFDIAIGLCEKPIGLEWYPSLYEKEDEVEKVCSMSGYGLPGTFSTGYLVHGDNLRRAGSNKIDSIDRDLLICTPSNHRRTSLEYCIAPGDSGGGLFIENRLAGINSCILAVDRKSKSDYGSECGHTRISKYVGWIKENIEEININKTEK
jgi:hypothetical protein